MRIKGNSVVKKMVRFETVIATLHLLVYSSGRDLSATVRRFNMNNEEHTRPASERQIEFALLWGEMAQSEDWDGYESIQHLLKDKTHSYSHHHHRHWTYENNRGHNSEDEDALISPPTSSPIVDSLISDATFLDVMPTIVPATLSMTSPTTSPTTSPQTSPTTSPITLPTTSQQTLPVTSQKTSPLTMPQATSPPPTILSTMRPTAFHHDTRSCATNDNKVVHKLKMNFAYVGESTTQSTNFILPLEDIILESVANSTLDCSLENTLIEMQSVPRDSGLASVPCNITHPDAVKCTVVLGYMTLGFTDAGEKSKEKRKVIRSIRNAMEGDLLLDSAKMKNLVRVTFVGPTESKKLKVVESKEEIRSKGGNTLVLGASIATIILLAGFTCNAVRSRRKDNEQSSFVRRLAPMVFTEKMSCEDDYNKRTIVDTLEL